MAKRSASNEIAIIKRRLMEIPGVLSFGLSFSKSQKHDGEWVDAGWYSHAILKGSHAMVEGKICHSELLAWRALAAKMGIDA